MLSGAPVPSICIPASVETLERLCLAGYLSLASVTFKTGFHLREVGPNPFYNSPLMGPCVFPNGVTPPAEQPDQDQGHSPPPPNNHAPFNSVLSTGNDEPS
ncbi:MAG: hypothetical protein LBJ70_02220 [Holosporales bacterium]|jgi:hypothetical protein|nr:hypothetical protein [Holosporales bacterium]